MVGVVASAALLACALFVRPCLADPHNEGVAKEAMQKAATDYSSASYAAAVTRLNAAVKACAGNHCVAATKAALLRDLGAMQFRAGDKNGATKSFGDALNLDQNGLLNPAYDASDVGASYEDARASAGLPAGTISTKPPPGGAAAPPAPPPKPATPPEPPLEQPTGDFEHDPAPEQKENTPLPVHVDYPGNAKIARVLLKYKGAQMRDWGHLELKHVEGNGYEATIPCGDVTRGVMRYWVQGFDKGGEPVAATGDPKHAYGVPIREKITIEPPHLPGKEAPHSCDENDCPPDLAGCKRKGEAAGAGGEGTAAAPGSGDEGDNGAKKEDTGPSYKRFWVGASIALDIIALPSAQNVCTRIANGPNAGFAVNGAGYYCYDPVAGADFPKQNVNTSISPTGGGTASSRVQASDVRVMLAFDYALSANFLAGARAGYVFNSYPGQAGPHFAPIHLEARATYLFGNAPLSRPSFAFMVVGGLGFSQFDGKESTRVNFTNGMAAQTVDVWLTDAPFFLMVGPGVRWQFNQRMAATGAVRVNVAIGANGLLPTVGPELGVVYGF